MNARKCWALAMIGLLASIGLSTEARGDGACCFTDGTCLEFSGFFAEQDCIAAGGSYQGDGSTCAGVDCEGACCLPDGSCSEGSIDDCDAGGGFFQGFGSACGSVFCGTGACCLPDETCATLNVADCEAQGGLHLGPSSDCTFTECEADSFDFPLSPGQQELEFNKFVEGTPQTRELIRVTVQLCGTIGALATIENESKLPNVNSQVSIVGQLESTFNEIDLLLTMLNVIAVPPLAPSDGNEGEGPDFFDLGFISASDCGMDVEDTMLAFFIGGPADTFTTDVEGLGFVTVRSETDVRFLFDEFRASGDMIVAYEFVPVVGACCLCTGQCIPDITAEECEANPDFYEFFEGLDCEDIECEARGACCLCDEQCLDDVTQDECEANPNFVCFRVCEECVDADCPGNPECEIDDNIVPGRTLVCPDSQNLEYCVSPLFVPFCEQEGDLGDPEYFWTITGDASFCPGQDPTEPCVCVNADDVCDGEFTLTATITVGNCSSMCTYTVTVNDGEDPVITCPPDFSVECVEDVPAPAMNLTEFLALGGSVTDNCEGPITVTFEGDGPLSDPCGGTIARTYRATDRCGNFDECVQTITVDDMTPPDIDCPPDDEVECVEDIPAPAANLTEFLALGGAVTDNCIGPITVTFEGDGPLSDPCGGTVQRTYRATDQCGNFADCIQTFTVNDETAPTINCPPDDTFECVEDIPAAAQNLAQFEAQGGSVSDNCIGDITVTFIGDTPLDDPCGGTVVRTYRATDECGNFEDCDQTFTINDTTAPTINCPPNVTVDCEDDVPAAAQNLAEFEGQGGSVSDNCNGDVTVTFVGDTPLDDPCGGTIERTYRATDQCGNSNDCVQFITVDDDVPPMISCPPNLFFECEDEVPPPAANLTEFLALGGSVSDNCGGAVTVDFIGDSPLTDPCGGTIDRTYRATDPCGNFEDCIQTITVNDTTPPAISCPPDMNNITGLGDVPPCAATIEEFIARGGAASDNCTDTEDLVIISCEDEIDGGPDCPLTVTRTYCIADECDNEVCCTRVFSCNPTGRCGCTEKGSLLVFSKIELRWDAQGNVVQDTFVQITNDYPADVDVQMYFINGDEPLPPQGEERPHPGWNWVDNQITLTSNQPLYWSALTGQPAGVSPFTVLDPGFPPGRPDPDGSGERVLRGYILAWAVNADLEEIRWNHLFGLVDLVNYTRGFSWEYPPCAFQVLDPNIPNGGELGSPGELRLNGSEYRQVCDLLLYNFQAAGSAAFSGPSLVVADPDLTLHLVDADLRQETEGPVTTKAHFEVWNENELKLSGAYRCITCWDQTLLRNYGVPNHFLINTLQTDVGKARIDGQASQLCPLSVDAALLGVQARFFAINAGEAFAGSGGILFGMGTESAVIQYDVGGGPPESPGLDLPPFNATSDELVEFVDTLLEQSGR
jgi:hypothetical protein